MFPDWLRIDGVPENAWAPRRVLVLISVGCVAMLGFGLYLQHVVGLEPCPMCIVQRYALVLIAIYAGFTASFSRSSLHRAGLAGVGLLAIG